MRAIVITTTTTKTLVPNGAYVWRLADLLLQSRDSLDQPGELGGRGRRRGLQVIRDIMLEDSPYLLHGLQLGGRGRRRGLRAHGHVPPPLICAGRPLVAAPTRGPLLSGCPKTLKPYDPITQ